MKKIFRNLMMLLCALTALVSCDESGDKIDLDGFKASDLMASASDVKLSVDNSKDVVLSLAWQNPTLLSSDETKPAGSGVLKTYLQVSASENFTSEKEYTVTDLSKAFTGADLNAAAKDLGLSPDVSSPLYFRIKSQMGNNLDAAYSNVCQVKVTPYLIDMSYINILDKDTKEQTLTYLYSPNSDGVYSGYMNASSWLNFWGKENDGTIWGNVGQDGHVYEMDNTESAWSFWFPGQAGIYYAVIDTKAKEFKPTLLKSFQLNGEDMTYDAPNYAWTKVITTTADNTPVSIVATGAEYSKATGTEDAAAVVKTMNYTLADGKMTDSESAGSVIIPSAGTYTITVKVGEHSQLEYTIVEGDQTTPEPEASNTLCMFSENGNTLLAVMNKVSDGVYTCKYKPTSWENFYFIYVGENKDDKKTWYGADGEQFKLTSGDGAWKIWFGDENGETEFTVTADLNTMTWKYE
ncbi:DUF5114 domain-containing protein [Segatella copri]|jgi:hypothetical protein|uniref:DUF5114 domain-containing protein n=2 Tax=Pseudomonadati TaxID=3379134 RepID=A0AAW5TXT4_9BACT|nr:DUF5114 domain-containing protein [Segatella copri]MCW4076423.1 DUF5114 domain-containing protein [Segatella copri]MCW4092128.1 DUF5114 domain-containing protein [Segatella copri]MCW4109476.1 DUF5114 domain-containing protein [Segatella copri]